MTKDENISPFRKTVRKILETLETELVFYGQYGKKLKIIIKFPTDEEPGYIKVGKGGYILITK